MPLSDWLSWVVNAYQSLFYPLLEATFGRIFSIFDIHLSEFVKDIFVFYFLFLAALFRVLYKEKRARNLDEEVDFDLLLGLILYPVVIFIIFYEALFSPDGMKENARQHAKWYLLEVSYVLIVVAAAIILNAAGVLS